MNEEERDQDLWGAAFAPLILLLHANSSPWKGVGSSEMKASARCTFRYERRVSALVAASSASTLLRYEGLSTMTWTRVLPDTGKLAADSMAAQLTFGLRACSSARVRLL